MEDFPSPGVKTIAEVKAKDDIEKILADLSEDERENSRIASGAAGSQELVGDVQLAGPIADAAMEEGPPEEPEEGLQVKVKPAPEEPTQAEREQHELMGHVVYRSWCRHCVNAAGYGHKHVKSSEEETALPMICCDYGFLKDDDQREDDCQTMLVVKDKKTSSYAATFVESKGATEYSTRFMTGFIRGLGWKRVSFKSDNEPALLALKKRVVESSQDIEMVPLESPVGDHAANGDAEEAVKKIKQQIRKMKGSLEDFFGEYLDPSHSLIAWLPRHAADLITKYKIGHDGKTADQRRTGKKWKMPLLQFGERAHFRLLKAEARKSGFGQKLLQGRFVGFHSRSGCLLMMTEKGVVRGQGFNRMTFTDRWDPSDLPKLRGLPWNLAEGRTKTPKPMLIGKEAARIPLVIQAPESGRKRDFYVLKKDYDQFGATEGCPACAMFAAGADTTLGTTHSKECRDRMKELIERAVEQNAADQAQIRRIEKTKKQEVTLQDAAVGPTADVGVEAIPEATASSSTAGTDASSAAVQRKGKRPAERSAEFEAETSLKRPLDDQEPGSPGYVRARVAEIDESTSSSAPKRQSDVSLEDLVVTSGSVDADVNVPRIVVTEEEAERDSSLSSLSSWKAQLMPLVRKKVSDAYRRQRVDLDDGELSMIACLTLEVGSLDVTEIYSPARYCAMAGKFGLSSGVSADSDEVKPNGEPWNLDKEEDVNEFMEMLEREDPFFLPGTPPCTSFSSLRNLSDYKRDPEVVENEKRIGRRHLWVACQAYKSQIRRGRYFLHEHPWSASSWQDEYVKEVMNMDGVQVVKGPMCKWDMMQESSTEPGVIGHVRKECGWMTNLPELAAILEGTCSNQTGEREWHNHVQLINGLAHFAQVHPPKLVAEVLKVVKRKKIQDGCLSSLESYSAGPAPLEPLFDEPMSEVMYWDDVNGGWLDPEMVKIERQKEIDWLHANEVYQKVPIDECWRVTGKPPIKLLWIDSNKGDDAKPNYRSRVVVREVRKKGPDGRVLPDAELFSGTPPLEAMKVLGSLLVSRQTSSRGLKLKLAFWDISRAFFYGLARRDVFIELPDMEQDGIHCGQLLKSMYGTQDAPAVFQENYTELLAGGGFHVGKSNIAIFYSGEHDARVLVHGDDFALLGDELAVAEFDKLLKSRYSVKKTGKLGFEDGDDEEVHFLNRILRVDKQKRSMEIEADPRHAEMFVRQLGLDNAKIVDVPESKPTKEELDEWTVSPLLIPSRATVYRSLVMRAAYMATDRADLGHCVKNLAKKMQTPRECDMKRLMRLGRYIKGHPRVIQLFERQRMPNMITCYGDSDHAGDVETRRSTVGQVIMLGTHCVKHCCNLLSQIGLSSAENEYYAICGTSATGMGLQALLHDWNISMELKVLTDSSSAKSFASRRGLGRMKHIQTRFLWIQERLALKHFVLNKVGTLLNRADVLTKQLSAKEMYGHLEAIGHILAGGRAKTAKRMIGTVDPTSE